MQTTNLGGRVSMSKLTRLCVACVVGLWLTVASTASAAPAAFSISVDRGPGSVYSLGESIRIFYAAPAYPATIAIYVDTSEGSSLLASGLALGPGSIDRPVTTPSGPRHYRLVLLNGNVILGQTQVAVTVVDRVTLTADRGEGGVYVLGDPITLSYTTSRAMRVIMVGQPAAGAAYEVLDRYYGGAVSLSLSGTVGREPGPRTYTLYGYVGNTLVGQSAVNILVLAAPGATPSITPSPTTSATASATPTGTPTLTPTPSATPTSTATQTASSTPTASATPSATSLPSVTLTSTPTATSTLPPTSTATLPPTAITATLSPPNPTRTRTVTVTTTSAPSTTPTTQAATLTATVTASATPTPSAPAPTDTAIPASSATASPSATATSTASTSPPSLTPTLAPTLTPTTSPTSRGSTPTPFPGCPADAWEPNNSFASAIPLTFEVETHGAVCPAEDLDLFSVRLARDDELSIRLSASAPSYAVYLYNSQLSEVAVNENTAAGDKIITYRAATADANGETFYILVINRSLDVPADPFYRLVTTRGLLNLTPTPGPSLTPTPTRPTVAQLFLPYLAVSGQPPLQ